jgi:hypothetical protein
MLALAVFLKEKLRIVAGVATLAKLHKPSAAEDRVAAAAATLARVVDAHPPLAVETAPALRAVPSPGRVCHEC